MAKFLNTRRAVSEIEDLIKTADQTLILISPYLKLSKDFKELLTYRNSKDKVTTIIFGKQELNPDEMNFLQGVQFVSLWYNENLHAKCYLNDNKMIITSLNLYQFSMVNNKEMGVLIDKNEVGDTELFIEALKEVDYIRQTSKRFPFDGSKPQQVTKSFEKPQPPKSPIIKENGKPNGFCIRTGVSIPFSPEKPLSYEAYKSWNQFGDPNYPEKFCHFSGESSNGETSVAKPILYKNWKKAKEVHGL
jgi:phosphatidylserine/phosphatidylglycerophosphate/cardiolipin synthase-like enzyme